MAWSIVCFFRSSLWSAPWEKPTRVQTFIASHTNHYMATIIQRFIYVHSEGWWRNPESFCYNIYLFFSQRLVFWVNFNFILDRSNFLISPKRISWSSEKYYLAKLDHSCSLLSTLNAEEKTIIVMTLVDKYSTSYITNIHIAVLD